MIGKEGINTMYQTVAQALALLDGVTTPTPEQIPQNSIEKPPIPSSSLAKPRAVSAHRSIGSQRSVSRLLESKRSVPRLSGISEVKSKSVLPKSMVKKKISFQRPSAVTVQPSPLSGWYIIFLLFH